MKGKNMMTDSVHFAVVGDVHGHMHRMVAELQFWEQWNDVRLNFVLQVGDFEPVRYDADLASVHVPQKYRKLGDFVDYTEGRATFPWPVWFIGGNHEPYGYLDQQPDGFALLDHCQYLGRAGHATIGGLRLAWLSAIHHPEHFDALRPDVMAPRRMVSPKRFTYFNAGDIARLKSVTAPDLMLFHEWPEGLSESSLFKRRRGTNPKAGQPGVGNAVAAELIRRCRPPWVFCGHMHEAYCGEIRTGSATSQVVCLAAVGSSGSFAIMRKGDEGLRMVALDDFLP